MFVNFIGNYTRGNRYSYLCLDQNGNKSRNYWEWEWKIRDWSGIEMRLIMAFPCTCDYSLTSTLHSSHVWPVLYLLIVVFHFLYEFSMYISVSINLVSIVVVIIIFGLLTMFILLVVFKPKIMNN